MRKSLHLLVFVLALALAYASAQSSGSSPSTSGQSTTSQPSQDQKPEAQSGSSQSGSSATASSSTDVQSQIQDALKKDPALTNANITVSVTDDAVELNGTVASNDEKRAAKKVAKSYAGNRKVKDNLTVSGGGSGTKPTPPGGMGFFSPGAYRQSQSSQQQQPAQPSGSQSGTAQSPSTSQSPPAEPSSTQTPPNPNGSVNQTPSSTEQTPSSGQQPGTTAAAGGDIQMQIQNALQKEPTLSNDNISVNVTDDTIELSGTVNSGKEKQTAKRIAQSYAGNRKVKEHLTVSGQGSSDNKNPDHNMTTPPSGNSPSADPNKPSYPPSPSRPPRN
jgi:osmotically-inducible protein OsmY